MVENSGCSDWRASKAYLTVCQGDQKENALKLPADRRPQQETGEKSGLVSFAGFDTSGGAGILADCRTFETFGFDGMAIMTAFTVQGANRIAGAFEVPAGTIYESARLLARERRIAGIKVGMLFNEATVKETARALDLFHSGSIVIDPVINASDGTVLLDAPGIETMKTLLFPKARVITPNVPEAEFLTGLKITGEKSIEKAGKILLKMGPEWVVIKGGHLKGRPVDYLATEGSLAKFDGKRIIGKSVHGTGCLFSSALTALLARGHGMDISVKKAKDHVTGIIEKLRQ